MTVDDLKAELNITHDADDAILTRKLASAQGVVERYIGQSLADLDPLPAEIAEAVLQIAAQAYSIGDGDIPAGVVSKLRAHRNWTF